MLVLLARIIIITFLVLPAGLAEGAQLPEPKAGGPKLKTDLYGDPLPPGAVTRFGTVRFRHGGPVQAVAYSADGKTLISAGRMGDSDGICIWNASTGKELRRLTGHKDHILSLAFSLDGNFLVTGSYDATALVWQVR